MEKLIYELIRRRRFKKGNGMKNNPDFLWKVISRFDNYISTTNTKATVIVAFNTFIFSAIVLKWNDLLTPFGYHRIAAFITSTLLLIAASAALVSLAAVFAVINPFLKSPKNPTKYHSKIFFGHVAEFEKPDDYHQCVRKNSDDELIEDLCMQAHILARGLDDKFKRMKMAVGTILFVQLPSLGLMILVKIITAVLDIL